MNNIDLKAQLGPNEFFKPNAKNDLKKNLVASFEGKDANMDLEKELDKERKLKKKKQKIVESKKQESSNKNENPANQKELIKKLMNVI